jgi:hypothetical protein
MSEINPENLRVLKGQSILRRVTLGRVGSLVAPCATERWWRVEACYDGDWLKVGDRVILKSGSVRTDMAPDLVACRIHWIALAYRDGAVVCPPGFDLLHFPEERHTGGFVVPEQYRQQVRDGVALTGEYQGKTCAINWNLPMFLFEDGADLKGVVPHAAILAVRE